MATRLMYAFMKVNLLIAISLFLSGMVQAQPKDWLEEKVSLNFGKKNENYILIC